MSTPASNLEDLIDACVMEGHESMNYEGRMMKWSRLSGSFSSFIIHPCRCSSSPSSNSWSASGKSGRASAAFTRRSPLYALSVDYSGDAPVTKEFFASVQNKLHWAITGQTAAELIYSAADATKLTMGLATWKHAPGGKILKSDVTVAKNYLNEAHVKELNRIISASIWRRTGRWVIRRISSMIASRVRWLSMARRMSSACPADGLAGHLASPSSCVRRLRHHAGLAQRVQARDFLEQVAVATLEPGGLLRVGPEHRIRSVVAVALSLAELCEARDVPPGRRCANMPPAAPLRESRRYNGGADINGVNVRRVWDAACSHGRRFRGVGRGESRALGIRD